MILAINGRIGHGKDTVGKIIQFLMHTEGKWDLDYWNSRTDFGKVAGIPSHFQNYWAIKKFAGKLKQVATLLTGVPLEKWEDQDFKKQYMPSEWDYEKQMFENDEKRRDGFATVQMTYREFLQKLGTEAMRNGLHTNVWVNALFADYKDTDSCSHWTDEGVKSKPVYRMPNWLITDMHFPNEFEAVKERGGFCVRVEREMPCRVCRLTLADRRGKPCYDMMCPNGLPNKGLHESETALDSHKFDYVLNNSGTIEELVEEVRKMLIHFKLLP